LRSVNYISGRSFVRLKTYNLIYKESGGRDEENSGEIEGGDKRYY